MAQQPRQQRIGFYGKFTPTALDTSEADKMRALAGLGQTIADTSLSIAKPMVTAERAEQGAEAAEGMFGSRKAHRSANMRLRAHRYNCSLYPMGD